MMIEVLAKKMNSGLEQDPKHDFLAKDLFFIACSHDSENMGLISDSSPSKLTEKHNTCLPTAAIYILEHDPKANKKVAFLKALIIIINNTTCSK